MLLFIREVRHYESRVLYYYSTQSKPYIWKWSITSTDTNLTAVAQGISCEADKLRTTVQHLANPLKVRVKVVRFVGYSHAAHQPLSILTLGLYADCATKMKLLVLLVLVELSAEQFKHLLGVVSD